MPAHRLLAVGLVAALVGLGAPASARADAVTDWNAHATTALIVAAGQAPPVSVLHLAMVHGAVYDAVNAIDGGREGYLLSARLATRSDSKEAAAATAAYRVLAGVVPAQQPALEALYVASLAAVPEGASKVRGIAVGEAAAAAMLAARTGDGRFGSFRFTIGTTPGAWRPPLEPFVNDPNAWLKDVKPFLIADPSRLRTRGPHALTSREYARELAEVRAVGAASSTTRAADQTNAARYWATHPAATWSRIMRGLATQRGLDVVASSRLFAMAYLSAADALISVWVDKARWSNWRPITAIQEAATDGNPATEPDAGWLPLIGNPPYPEHPSGHTGLSGSIVAALQDFFGSDRVAWEDVNPAAGNLKRGYSRPSQAIAEIVDVRVWSGIHFRRADEDGAQIARWVARWRRDHFFQPLHEDH